MYLANLCLYKQMAVAKGEPTELWKRVDSKSQKSTAHFFSTAKKKKKKSIAKLQSTASLFPHSADTSLTKVNTIYLY